MLSYVLLPVDSATQDTDWVCVRFAFASRSLACALALLHNSLMAGNKRKKNPSGQGGVSERRDGRYDAYLTVCDPDGTKRVDRVTKPTRLEALRWLNKRRHERDEGVILPRDAERITVAGYLRRWLSDSVEGTVSRHTYRDYRDKVGNHIIPALGRKKLKDLTHQDLQALYRKKTEEGLSARTVRYVHTTMGKALHEAEAADLVRKNVARFAKPPKPDAEEREPMAVEEIRAFLTAIRGHKDEALYLLAITTGMRRGELFGLRWPDVDLEKRRYKVSHSLDTLYGPPVLKDPKRGSGKRSGILLPEVVAALEAHRKRQLEDRLRAGPRWQENGYVFPTNRGTPQRADNVLKRSLKPLCVEAGLRPLTFTDLRHSCATTLALLGVHLRTAIKIMGHASEAMLLNVYTHVLDEMEEDAAERLRSFLFGAD